MDPYSQEVEDPREYPWHKRRMARFFVSGQSGCWHVTRDEGRRGTFLQVYPVREVRG